MERRRAVPRDQVIIALCWLAAALLVNPRGNFPLNDDWAYGKAVQSFLNTGMLHLPDWVSTTLVAQLLWGSLFCLPFGFSFTALRISVLFMGLAGLIGCYHLFLEFTERRIALLATLIIAVNPLFFHLSCTFMTDVPFFSLQCMALLYMVRYLKEDRRHDLLTAIAWSIPALLTRHIGIVFLLAFLPAYLFRHGLSFKKLFIASLPLLSGCAALLLYGIWMHNTQETPSHLNSINDQFTQHLSQWTSLTGTITRNIIHALLYIGLFVSPLLILKKNRLTLRQALIPAAFGLFLLIKLLVRGNLMPLAGNTLRNYGVGPPTLKDVDILGLPNLPSLPSSLWYGVTIISILGLCCLCMSIIALLSSSTRKDSTLVFTGTCLLLYILAICISGFYDRYLLPVIPLGLILLTQGSTRQGIRFKIISCAMIAGFAYFSITATHDYLAWNRVRWQALRQLTETQHIPDKEIDGGFEFNGFYTYSREYRRAPGKSWWWVINDTYTVSFGPIPGYSILSLHPYQNWLPLEQRTLKILKKEEMRASSCAGEGSKE